MSMQGAAVRSIDSKSPTSDKRKVDETPVTLPPSKKSKAAVSVKQSTLRRYPRQNTVPTIDIDSKESHSDAVRRRRSPRGGTSAKHKHEEAVNTAPNQIAKTDVLDDEAEATMSMDEETRKMDEELRAWMGKRSDEQEELTQLEKQIYELEGSYLRRSQHAGNIVKGYADANVFVAEMAKDEAQVDTPELEAAVQAQRLFSHSSTTSPAEPFKAAAEDAARDITETPAAK
ncbi:hypothetical protein H310_00742 [Aphanomyces invadans]|uniref:Chromatin modification-related protein EAF6 n=1 Tax=Aphanomyces invadans TaxID=157072 RepID=A0A024UWY8_9STRA|nr:hypothetical protein H310_00742 [Aphanomyces invadans]ETW10437.1 hypothetical protein H310_00742 [Aphanomyces invadans]|eukprot:XP_008861848.1 hypothetical protein H310_00742 [Aphanomyces invadans]